MQVGASNNQFTTFGARIPTGPNAPTSSQEGGIMRIRAGQPLPEGMDALLTPQDMKQLYDQGYLDVQRQFTTMESNEGIFTLTAKLAAAIVGPSRSVGAIQIDPLFLEMIKDPNAEVGFGFTRVRNETLRVLPSPAADPAIQSAPRPSVTPPPSVPLLVDPNDPARQPRPPKEVTPVDSDPEPQDISAETQVRGLFNHDSTQERKGDNIDYVNKLASFLRENGYDDESFLNFIVNASSNVLRGEEYNNTLTPNRANQFDESIQRGGNSDSEHRAFLREHFGIEVHGSRTARNNEDRHFVTPTGGEGPQPTETFVKAVNELFFRSTGTDGRQAGGYNTQLLQRDRDIITNVDQVMSYNDQGDLVINPDIPLELEPDAEALLTNILKEQGVSPDSPEFAAELKNLALYSQSYLEHRSYEVDVNVNITSENVDEAQSFLGKLEEMVIPEDSREVYENIKSTLGTAVTNFLEQGQATLEGQQNTISNATQNINTLNQTNISPESIANMQATIEDQIGRLPSEGPNSPAETPAAGFENLKKATNAEGDTVLVPRDEPLQEGFSAVEPDTVTLADWGTAASPGPLQTLVLNTATTPEASDLPDPLSALTTAQGNIERLDGLAEVMPEQPVDPRSINSFQASIAEQIGIVESAVAELEANPNRTPEENELLATLKGGTNEAGEKTGLEKLRHDFGVVQEKIESKLHDQRRLEGLAEGEAGGETGQVSTGSQYLNSVGQNLDQFRDYVRTSVADGKITHEEKGEMQSFVTATSTNLTQYLSSRGVSMTGTNPAQQLNSVTQADLISAGFNETEASNVMGVIDRLQFAQASLNVTSEGTHTARLYESVQQLNRRLDDFEQLEVVKTAFKSEMQTLAENRPQFENLMNAIFVRDGQSQISAETMNHLHSMAESGDFPMPPNLGFADRAQLGGGNGAYIEQGQNGEPVVLIARDLMNNSGAMRDVFFEEMFHHLENSLGLADSEGDEGQAGAAMMTELRHNPDADAARLKSVGDAMRMEASTIDPNVATINQEDAALTSVDYGTLNRNITDERGNVIAQAGSSIEFSSNATTPAQQQPQVPEQPVAQQQQPQEPTRPDGRASIDYNRELGVNLNVQGINPHQSHIRGSSEIYDRGIGNDQSTLADNFSQPVVLNNIQDQTIRSAVDSQLQELMARGATPQEAVQQAQKTLQENHGFSAEQAQDVLRVNNISEVATEYDTEPGTIGNIMNTVMDNLGTGLMSLGKSMNDLAEIIKATVAKHFADVAMRLQQADPNKIAAYDVVYGEGGWHGHDTDVSRGRPDDYGRLQVNQTLDRTMNPNKAYSSNPNATPNYLQGEQAVNQQEANIRAALRLEEGEPTPTVPPSDEALRERGFTDQEIRGVRSAFGAAQPPVTSEVIQRTQQHHDGSISRGSMREKSPFTILRDPTQNLQRQ